MSSMSSTTPITGECLVSKKLVEIEKVLSELIHSVSSMAVSLAGDGIQERTLTTDARSEFLAVSKAIVISNYRILNEITETLDKLKTEYHACSVAGCQRECIVRLDEIREDAGHVKAFMLRNSRAIAARQRHVNDSGS